jgi:hypothetical protein
VLEGIKRALFGRAVARYAKEASMGKLGTAGKAVWNFLDGWKTWIWAVVMALKIAFPQLPVWGYVDAAAGALGWNAVAPAVDPGQLVQWGTFAIAVGHRLKKAIDQSRAGVPIADLHSGS